MEIDDTVMPKDGTESSYLDPDAYIDSDNKNRIMGLQAGSGPVALPAGLEMTYVKMLLEGILGDRAVDVRLDFNDYLSRKLDAAETARNKARLTRGLPGAHS